MNFLWISLVVSWLFMHPQYPQIPIDSLSPTRNIIMQRPPLLKYELKQKEISSASAIFWQDRGARLRFEFPNFRLNAVALRGQDFTPFDSGAFYLWFISTPRGFEGETEVHGWRRRGITAHSDRIRGQIFELREDGIFIGLSLDYWQLKVSDTARSDMLFHGKISTNMIIPVSKSVINAFSTDLDFASVAPNPNLTFKYSLRGIISNRLLLAPGFEINRIYEKLDARPQFELQYPATRALFLRARLGYYAGAPRVRFPEFIAPCLDSVSSIQSYGFGELGLDIKPSRNLTILMAGRYEKGHGRVFRKGAGIPYLYSSGDYELIGSEIRLRLELPHIRLYLGGTYNAHSDNVFYVPDYEAWASATLPIRMVSLLVNAHYVGPLPVDEGISVPSHYTVDVGGELDLPLNLHLKAMVQNVTDWRDSPYIGYYDVGRKYNIELIWLNEGL